MANRLLFVSLSRRLSSTTAAVKYNKKTSSTVPVTEVFQVAKHGSFIQSSPELYNPFIEDQYLRTHLSQRLPSEVCEGVFQDLETFGSRISSEISTLGREAETHPPVLRQYDGWGKRVDQLVTSEAWRKLHDISAEEGLVAIGYERQYGEWSRLHQFTKIYLFASSSGLYSCPLAMTDGAAKLIEEVKDSSLQERAYPRLISRDPHTFWTSGQWMTEKGGGSDVARGTTTIAIPHDDDTYRLHGYKWFSSATDADMAFTLARIQDNDGNIIEGTEGLSLFYVETKNEQGQLNNILIEQLKNKLGTRQLPTAELLLNGTIGQLVGEKGRGIAEISPMLTITRLHNTFAAVSSMRRMLFLSRDYCTKREAFGQYLVHYPLHMRTLAGIELEIRGCTLFALELAQLLGQLECGLSSSDNDKSLLLRLLMPIAKLYTAKMAVAITSEGLETFGGQGYIEDTGLPTLYRDSQVLPIWEGTTNILSLDVLRALQKTNGEALQALVHYVKTQTSMKDRIQYLELETEAHTINEWMDSIVKFITREDPNIIMTAARDIAFTLANIYIGALLLEKACHKSSNILDLTAFKRWCYKGIPLQSPDNYKSNINDIDLHLVMDGYKLSLQKMH